MPLAPCFEDKVTANRRQYKTKKPFLFFLLLRCSVTHQKLSKMIGIAVQILELSMKLLY